MTLYLHSSFRTASTWLWAKLRQDTTVAFCEPFNEFLAEISQSNIQDRKPESWASGHPSTEPYFVEYGPLIDGVGVAGYDRSFAFERFFPQAGVRGEISPAEVAYLSSLESAATMSGRTAVLGFTRSLGRAPGIRKAMGGYHVFLYRPLLDQWLSYWSQYQHGMPYFLQTVGRTLEVGRSHSPALEEIFKRCWVGHEATGNVAGFVSATAAFEAFVAIHAYLYSFVEDWADLQISTRRLASERRYRATISNALRNASGISVDLDDASRRLSAIDDFGGATTRAVEIVERLVAAEKALSPAVSTIVGELLADLALAEAVSSESVAIIHRLTSDNAEVLQQLRVIAESKRYRWANGLANAVNQLLGR
jgi:hypothetical protein